MYDMPLKFDKLLKHFINYLEFYNYVKKYKKLVLINYNLNKWLKFYILIYTLKLKNNILKYL